MKHPTGQNKNGRRTFIHAVAAGAATIGFSSFNEASLPLETKLKFQNPDDPEAWVERIKGKHKIVFDVPQPNEIFPFAWPRVFLNTNKSTGSAESDCCAVVVLRHSGIAYAFNHSMWQKYNFSELFQANDPKTQQRSLTNPFWNPAAGTYSVPGVGTIPIGINELMSSGVLFGVCGLAITVFGNRLATSLKQDAETVVKDLTSNIIPGIQPLPSGVWALGRAQEKGCGYIFAG